MTADEEELHIIASANAPIDPETNELRPSTPMASCVPPSSPVRATSTALSALPPTCRSKTSTT
ncbi:MAG: hypothetical protein ACLTKG_08845 [Collinsella intestinalis]